ncbi:hypothetical protein ZWY2020_050054 [Hordeum vulgare]|nr:hypothetical protein ZWY2020_050054 [Hordeum vulgare]
MVGRGSKQPPLQRQSGQQAGLGNPLVAKSTATAAAQPGKTVHVATAAQQGKTNAPAHVGRIPSGAAGQAREPSHVNSYQQRSRWGDDGFSAHDNAEGSKDTGPNDFPKQTSNPQQNQPNLGAGNGPSNSAMHKDLRFGAFGPTSAPAKIGSQVASFEPSLPRFLGKSARTYKHSEQSKSALKPLSLEEYLVGAKATSTLATLTGVGPDIACMEVASAGMLGSPICQPQVDDVSQLLQLQVDEVSALHGQGATLDIAGDVTTTGLVKLCSGTPEDMLPVSDFCLGHGYLSAASVTATYSQESAGEAQDMCMLAVAETKGSYETACAGDGSDYARQPVPEAVAAVLASTVGAQMGYNPCAAQIHDGEVTCMHTHAATLDILEENTDGGCYSTPSHIASVLPAPAVAQATSVGALASARASTDSTAQTGHAGADDYWQEEIYQMCTLETLRAWLDVAEARHRREDMMAPPRS